MSLSSSSSWFPFVVTMFVIVLPSIYGREYYECTMDKRLTNGCNYVFDEFKSKFTPACNKHDICYYCGHNFGITRQTCDNAFYDHMVDICKGNFGCQFYALIYFSGTSLFGRSFYIEEPLQVCRQPCVVRLLQMIKTTTKARR